MLDQLPVMAALRQYLEHLSLMDPPPIKRDLILEQVRMCACDVRFVIFSVTLNVLVLALFLALVTKANKLTVY